MNGGGVRPFLGFIPILKPSYYSHTIQAKQTLYEQKGEQQRFTILNSLE